MEQTHYMAIALGKEKQFGAIVPFDDSNHPERYSFVKKAEEGKIIILYEGSDLRQARREIASLKTIEELIESNPNLFPNVF